MPKGDIDLNIGIDISESSPMRRFRVTLLAYNDTFQDQAAEIRRVLGIPETGIPDVDLSLLPDPKWSKVGKLRSESLWVLWSEVHAAKAKHESYQVPSLPPNIPEWYLQSLASERCIACEDEEVPSWLVAPSHLDFVRIDADPLGRYDPQIPLDRFVGRLIECFRLPRLIFRNVRLYIGTNNLDDIACPGPFDVDVYSLFSQWGLESGVIVEGIDHHSTREQWLEVWERYVRPKIERVWTLRGQTSSYHKHEKTWERYRELYVLRRKYTIDETLRRYADLHEDIQLTRNTVLTATKFVKANMKPYD